MMTLIPEINGELRIISEFIGADDDRGLSQSGGWGRMSSSAPSERALSTQMHRKNVFLI